MSLLTWLGIGEARRLEREALVTAIRSMEAVAVATAHTAALQSQAILDAFKTTSPPELREFDDVAATNRYLEKTYGDQLAQMELPSELRGLNLADQFQRVLDKLDS